MKKITFPEFKISIEGTPANVKWHRSISEIPVTEWNNMALKEPTPFLEWEWLRCLETSKSIDPSNGWYAIYLVIHKENEGIIAGSPFFLKSHSFGEFIYDHNIAHAAEKFGFEYYPKLVGMSPFTPGSRYSILVKDESVLNTVCELVGNILIDFCNMNEIFAAHLLHASEKISNQFQQLGFQEWWHESYIWKNPGFNSFDDFLSTLTSKRRKNIRQERKKFASSDCIFQIKTGNDITVEDLHQMHDFYVDTCSKFGMWGSKYLTRQFFVDIHASFAQRIVLILASFKESPNSVIGQSIFIRKEDELFGRYWGSNTELDFLHFELCYYKPIEWAIENKLRNFDAGAGNKKHKIWRGFNSERNRSLHYFANKEFSGLAGEFIKSMNTYLELGEL